MRLPRQFTYDGRDFTVQNRSPVGMLMAELHESHLLSFIDDNGDEQFVAIKEETLLEWLKTATGQVWTD